MKTIFYLSVTMLLLLFVGCDNQSSMGANDSPQKFTDSCSSRILSKKPAIGAVKAEAFCSCVLAEATKKYTVSELNEKMESGASRAFKDTLDSEVQLCNYRIK